MQELSYSEFLADKRTQQAIALNFIIIGECSGKIMDRYPEFVAKHPEIQWIKMRGMRNQVAHAYSDINLDVVWDTVQTSLLKLISKLNEQS